uniref:Sodium/calcium exchanger membrane region domain-containing protein n=1 Tax=Knipowitschia caucasica TaxID=637954 RepID=A0AAV2IZF9_KNICA
MIQPSPSSLPPPVPPPARLLLLRVCGLSVRSVWQCGACVKLLFEARSPDTSLNMPHKQAWLMPDEADSVRQRNQGEQPENHGEYIEHHYRFPQRPSQTERLCPGSHHRDHSPSDLHSPEASGHHFCQYTPKCFLTVHKGGPAGSTRSTASWYGDEAWHDSTTRTTIRVENEVEAHREANNYKFGFRKWKGHVTERPIEVRSDIDKELYSDLSTVRPQEGKLCWKMGCYFIWPFGKSIQKASDVRRTNTTKPPRCQLPEDGDSQSSEKDSSPLLASSPYPVEVPVPEVAANTTSTHWHHPGTYVWLLLGYPVLVAGHFIAFLISWLLVFTIPVAKLNTRAITTVLLMAPDDIIFHKLDKSLAGETRVVLCCNKAINLHYYKYSVLGINIFALNLLPLVITSLAIGYTDSDHAYFSAETKFATAITSIIPLSYFIGMGIASISAQSNFAVGAVVNATFGSITEMTFYITGLLQGQKAATKCYEEIVKAALTGTLLGCILFIPGICMIIGGIKHQEQKFNSRSAGVSSSLLFISIGGVFAPTLFSKTFGNLVCESCTSVPGNTSVPFICKDCHYDSSQTDPQMILSHIEPLVYTIAVLLPTAYLIGLIFTLKTHAHIYDIHVSDIQGGHPHGQYPQETLPPAGSLLLAADNSCINASIVAGHRAVPADPVVHWSRWRALAALIIATVLMACCADLSIQNIEPMLTHSSISQYFIGVTLLAMVPELPEIVNGIQFALQNNISLSLEVGSCIAVQVCMIQIPLLILFNAFYDVGFVLLFSDIHLWASIFSVILVNYIFMDGKCDYFQGTALVVVYLILMALYFFAPSPRSCPST